MTIRKAEEKDILRIIELLGQVLQINEIGRASCRERV